MTQDTVTTTTGGQSAMGTTVQKLQQKIRSALAVNPPEAWDDDICAAVLAVLDDHPDDDAQALADKVLNACRLVTDDAPMRAHTEWEVVKLLEDLHPSELTDMEMMGLAIILAGANARSLLSPPTLRLCPELREFRGA